MCELLSVIVILFWVDIVWEWVGNIFDNSVYDLLDCEICSVVCIFVLLVLIIIVLNLWMGKFILYFL